MLMRLPLNCCTCHANGDKQSGLEKVESQMLLLKINIDVLFFWPSHMFYHPGEVTLAMTELVQSIIHKVCQFNCLCGPHFVLV